ncbi:MAG: hypothetical protein E7601_09755 [Ruminococcaceae bacterium]|nr:hypothetical protein [Oscillospiraceae bacterium]
MSDVNEKMLKINEYELLSKLPDPFLFDDGSRVSSKEEWEKRRAEIYKTAVELQYGTIPPTPEFFKAELTYKGGPGRSNTYRITCGTEKDRLTFRMKLFLPEKKFFEDGKKVPVIVDGDMCFNYAYDKEFWHTATDKGIAMAMFDRTELVSDLKLSDRPVGPLCEIYPEKTFGALGAWAWGYARCVDALATTDLIDMDNIAFTGHSRGGKTALLAGVLDERAAIVNPNGSGAGGSGCYRIHVKAEYLDDEEKRTEQLSDLLRNFPFWFGPDMKDYAVREGELPFDEHMLKSLVAPRTLLSTEGAGDIWANAVGTWQTTLAAKEVYKFLGAEDEVYLYFRDGYHNHKASDLAILVELIEKRASGTPVKTEFWKLPFEKTENAFDFEAPKK